MNQLGDHLENQLQYEQFCQSALPGPHLQPLEKPPFGTVEKHTAQQHCRGGQAHLICLGNMRHRILGKELKALLFSVAHVSVISTILACMEIHRLLPTSLGMVLERHRIHPGILAVHIAQLREH